MLATRLHAIGDLRLEEVPVPDPGPGEVLVRVHAAGICGTDRHLFKGEFPSKPPVTLGHEFAGTVVACGAGVTLPDGVLVTCDPNDWCGTCDACRRGKVNLCARNVATGIHRDGGFAEYAAFPAHKAVILPAGLDPRHGAFCEPLACTLHGVDIGAPRPGERVLVIGGGVIGLLALQLAALAGAEAMLLTRNPEKRALAARIGAAATAADAAAVRAAWPEGADLTLECAGVPETVAEAGALTRAGGRVVILGVLPQGERVPIEPFDLLVREYPAAFLLHQPLHPDPRRRAHRQRPGRRRAADLAPDPARGGGGGHLGPGPAGGSQGHGGPGRLSRPPGPAKRGDVHAPSRPRPRRRRRGDRRRLGHRPRRRPPLRRGGAPGLHRRPRARPAGRRRRPGRRLGRRRRRGGDGGRDRRQPPRRGRRPGGGGGRTLGRRRRADEQRRHRPGLRASSARPAPGSASSA